MSVATLELLRAAASGDIIRLRAILAQGVDVNSTNKSNQSALMLAAAFRREEIVRYLLAVGADVHVQDELGMTAADWARQDIRIVQLLNRPPASVLKREPLSQSGPPGTRTLEGVSGAILRDHTTPNSAFAASVARERPVVAESVSASKETIAPDTALRAAAIISEPSSVTHEVDIPSTHRQPTSPARTLYRVGFVVALLGGAFLNYHVGTSVLTTLRSRAVKQDPEPTPVSAATTKPTKSAPVVGNELAAAALFVPDAEYPPNATANGNVTVSVQVSRKGIVVKAEAIDGDESLRDAAEKAALTSAFDPDKIQSESLLIDGTIIFNFMKPDDVKPNAQDFGLIGDAAVTPKSVSANAGGPLAGAERKLVVPKIPKWVTVEQKSATVVIRVNNKTGRAMSWRSLDADDRLRSYIIKAARASTFDPDKLSGEGNVVGIITYKFQ